ncbi:MAG: hypothetical protein ACAH83_20100 [Alphaproteobacteria bacterium]
MTQQNKQQRTAAQVTILGEMTRGEFERMSADNGKNNDLTRALSTSGLCVLDVVVDLARVVEGHQKQIFDNKVEILALRSALELHENNGIPRPKKPVPTP